MRITSPETVPNYIFMLHYYAASQPFDLLTVFHLHNLFHLLPVDDWTFPKYLWQIIVVDFESIEQQIVLHICSRALQGVLSFSSALPSPDNIPEASIVLIVDVTVHLSPRKVVPQNFVRRVANSSSVKSRGTLKFSVWKILAPIHHIRRCKEWAYNGD